MKIVSDNPLVLLSGFRISADKVNQLLNFSEREGKMRRVSTEQMCNRLVDAIDKLSPMLLDNMDYLIVKSTVYENHAKNLGIAVEDLTQGNKKDAFLEAVLEFGKENIVMSEKMDMSDIAALMLEYERMQKKADALRQDIERAVLAHGKTIVVGNVRASYLSPKKFYDHRSAVLDKFPDASFNKISGPVISKYTSEPKVSWAKVTKSLGINVVGKVIFPASCKVKIL